MGIHIIHVLCLALIGFVHLAPGCDDLDSQACSYMAAKRPDLCADENIAKTACPKFCNRCPIRCYSCNSTLSDYHLCTTIITCQSDEICLRRQLRSYLDGHEEFEMTCAKKTFCDDPWQGISMFGKREIKPRDVSISCCATDLCNYPMVTTTTTPSSTTAPGCKGCCKDLMIAVDESSSMDPSIVKQFLRNIVSSLSIGSTETLVSLGMFEKTGRVIFDIGDHLTKSSTLAAISAAEFHGGAGYAATGVDYLTNHATTIAGGDRPNYPNIILFLTDDYRPDLHGSDRNVQELHSKAAQVISVDIGQAHFNFLASSDRYYFHIRNQDMLHTISANVANLICENSTSLFN